LVYQKQTDGGDMNISIRHYINQVRVSGIVILSSEWREESGGYQHEHTIDEIICCKEEKPHRMRVHWIEKFFPRSELKHRIQEDTEISQTEYERLCQEHGGILDTVEYRERLAKCMEIERRLEETRPRCPKCEILMELRDGRHGIFWGCSRYPKCNGARKLTQALEAERSKLWEQLEEYRDL
jgi:hypothetical protein